METLQSIESFNFSGNRPYIACRGADTLPIDAIEEFQGNLKKRTKREISQIILSIVNYGFSFPFFVWVDAGHNRCLDGHGRIQAICEMRRRGADLPCFPVVYVEAVDEAEAKQKLLRLNSQYGTMTLDSVIEFAGGIDLDADALEITGVELVNVSEEDMAQKEKKEQLDTPYKQVHILLSMSPDTFAKNSAVLKSLAMAQGVEYEQSEN
jgi:hypothetical protein